MSLNCDGAPENESVPPRMLFTIVRCDGAWFGEVFAALSMLEAWCWPREPGASVVTSKRELELKRSTSLAVLVGLKYSCSPVDGTKTLTR